MPFKPLGVLSTPVYPDAGFKTHAIGDLRDGFTVETKCSIDLKTTGGRLSTSIPLDGPKATT